MSIPSGAPNDKPPRIIIPDEEGGVFLAQPSNVIMKAKFSAECPECKLQAKEFKSGLCASCYWKKRYHTHRDQILLKNRERYQENLEAERNKRRIRDAANPELTEKKRANYLKHKNDPVRREAVRKACREWRRRKALRAKPLNEPPVAT